MSLWQYWRGLYRLAFGFCPRCNSSPPQPGCAICDGSHTYGDDLDPEIARVWRTRWHWMRYRL